MLKFTKLSHLVVAVMASATITTVGTNVVTTNATQVEAKAATKVAADGPWSTTGDTANLPELQQLHNGNQIYYSIAPNDRNTKYFQQAVKDWNALGVINLVQVDWGSNDSQIQMSSSNDYSPDGTEDGNTTNDCTYNDGDYTAVMSNTVITLYKDSDTDSYRTKLITADHELGHALGFAHDNRKLKNGKAYKGYRLTMYWMNNEAKCYKLGGIEQRTLADHYDLQPTNGYLDTNC